MSRKASSNYEEKILKLNSVYSLNKLAEAEPALNVIKINNQIQNVNNNHRSIDEWKELFPGSAFFQGFDKRLGLIVIMVYEDPDSNKISTVIFCKMGQQFYNSLTLNEKSRFSVACDNLKSSHRESNVRRALAITLLKTYSLLNAETNPTFSTEWDETNAGELASSMKVIGTRSPVEVGTQLLSFGFLQPVYIDSTLVDIVYQDSPEIIDSNNKLVYLVGDQLEQLFDPLTEYSPEPTEMKYSPPSSNDNNDDDLSRSICDELIQFQKNTTQMLVEFLKEVVIPFRVKSLNGELENMNSSKINQVFPPTIDEVTRINCLFLDSLLMAQPYGSYEIVKVCGTTIPYFYKAYMRHESAIRNFAKFLRQFLEKYNDELPAQFTERKIETIVKCSLNLAKLKLILIRLLDTKTWKNQEEESHVQKYFRSAVLTIDSFGNDDLKPYNKRVFTPSGKILTELCDGWPSALSYGWLNRKVVSVFDAYNLITKDDNVVILFNDYIVLSKIIKNSNAEDSSEDDSIFKPKISDILMNSLINENPIKNLPNLEIISWYNVKDMQVFTFGSQSIKIIFKNGINDTFILKVDDNSRFLSLVNKAKILSKTTPFHLFKNHKFGLTVYSTAHEKKLYKKEAVKSEVALFLNMDIDEQTLEIFNLSAALSAKVIDQDTILVTGLTSFGETLKYQISPSEFHAFISEEVSTVLRKMFTCNNTLDHMFNSNDLLLKHVIEERRISECSNKISSSKTPRRHPSQSKTIPISPTSTINHNKPLPKINNSKPKTEDKITSNKRKLKNRLSAIFSLPKKKLRKSDVNQDKAKANVGHTQKATSRPISYPIEREMSQKFIQKYNTNDSAEIISEGDISTFESTMTAIFDEVTDSNENVEILASDSYSDFSSLRSDHKMRDNVPKKALHNTQTQLEPQHYEADDTSVKNLSIHQDELSVQNLADAKRQSETPHAFSKFPTFSSLDEDFQTGILKVPVDSEEDLIDKDEDVFYTPMIEDGKLAKIGSFDSFKLQPFYSNDSAQEDNGLGINLIHIKRNETAMKHSSTSSSTSADSFQSCEDADIPSHLVTAMSETSISPSSNKLTLSLEKDNSFGYLVNILDNSFVIPESLNASDSYKTIPRSYSSIKYLAPYIDSGTIM